MREQVIQHFPAAPGLPKNKSAYIKQVEEIYITDAYHSLSIEGYRVTPELIERVRTGSWNPDANQSDLEHHNALAARGYWQAYQSVLACVAKTLKGENTGGIAKEDHCNWYREMFAPGVTAGILDASDLAGYRNASVYIRGSMHVPPRSEAVRDAMPAFLDLLRDEAEPSVRVVLGHFIFIYIHPQDTGDVPQDTGDNPQDTGDVP